MQAFSMMSLLSCWWISAVLPVTYLQANMHLYIYRHVHMYIYICFVCRSQVTAVHHDITFLTSQGLFWSTRGNWHISRVETPKLMRFALFCLHPKKNSFKTRKHAGENKSKRDTGLLMSLRSCRMSRCSWDTSSEQVVISMDSPFSMLPMYTSSCFLGEAQGRHAAKLLKFNTKKSRSTSQGGCKESCGLRHMAVAQKPVPKWNPGKWKHGPKPAQPLLSHTHMLRSTICQCGTCAIYLSHREHRERALWLDKCFSRGLHLLGFPAGHNYQTPGYGSKLYHHNRKF